MYPLASNRQFLTWLCLYPFDRDTNVSVKMFSMMLALFLFAFGVCGAVSSIVFFVNNMSVDLEGCLYAVFQIAAYSGAAYLYVVAFILRNRIQLLFTTLAEIYEENSGLSSFHHFKHANDKSELLWKYYIKFILTGYPASTIGMAVVSVLFCHLTGKGFDAKHLYSPLKFALPWDQETPIGYLGQILYSVTVGETYLIFNASILLMFISISWHHQAFYERFRDSILALDDRNQNQDTKITLRELIRFHIRVKSWFMETADVYSPFVLIELIYSVIVLAAVMFQVDLQTRHLEFSFFILLMAVAMSVLNLFLFCYFGKIASESYEKMAQRLFESHWLVHPVEVQKYFVLMIQNIQKPIYYHGFEITNLELDKFTDMLRKAIQFYVMFKTITADHDH